MTKTKVDDLKDDGWFDHNRASYGFAILMKEWETFDDKMKVEMIFDLNAMLREQNKDLKLCGCGIK